MRDLLLDPKTARQTLEDEGDIKLPSGMTVIFYRQEDLPLRLVAVMPSRDPEQEHLPPIDPGFESCYLCTWITYRKDAAEQQEAKQISQQKDARDL